MKRTAFLDMAFSAEVRDIYHGACFLEILMGGVFYYRCADFLSDKDTPYVRRITFSQFEDFLEERGIDVVCEFNRKVNTYTFLIFQAKEGEKETTWIKESNHIFTDKQYGYQMVFRRCLNLLKNKI